MARTRTRHAGTGGRRRPSIGRGRIPPACRSRPTDGHATPDDHLRARPDRRVEPAPVGNTEVGRRPAVGHAVGGERRGDRVGPRRSVELHGERRSLPRPPGVERDLGPGDGRDFDGVVAVGEDGRDREGVPGLLDRADPADDPLARVVPEKLGELVATVRGLAVLAAGGREVLGPAHRRTRGFGAPAQRAVETGVVGIPVADQPIGERLPRERLRDDAGIVPEGVEQVREHPLIAGVAHHAADLGLELIVRDRTPPDRLEGGRLLEIRLDFRADRGVGHDLRERGLGRGVLRRPEAVLPVHLLDRPLGVDPVLEGQVAGPRRERGEPHEESGRPEPPQSAAHVDHHPAPPRVRSSGGGNGRSAFRGSQGV